MCFSDLFISWTCIFFSCIFFFQSGTQCSLCAFLCRKWKRSSKMNHCFLFFCLNVSFCQGVRLFFFIFHSNTTIIINNNSRLYSYYVAVLSIFFILIMFIFHYIFFYFQSFFLIFVKLFLMIYFQIHSCVKARVYALTKEIQSRIPWWNPRETQG